jgi:hypothetical protein
MPNNDISTTEPALPGAMTWSLRNANELGLGATGKLAVCVGNVLGGERGTMPSAGAIDWWDWRIPAEFGGSLLCSSLYFFSHWILTLY